jgi:hypothetical protein
VKYLASIPGIIAIGMLNYSAGMAGRRVNSWQIPIDNNNPNLSSKGFPEFRKGEDLCTHLFRADGGCANCSLDYILLATAIILNLPVTICNYA